LGDFLGTGIEIWAGIGTVGITEKKLGRFFLMFSWAKRNL
jgi:hypothetical protein